ncbi:MAG: Hsp20 family protein [Candidatus Omnitrophica bacterium]|jgi:HSP20 family molecular chaperone IbpA|nr:Hsp20 family protein [Candidatus Omnitrophota bacterium]
MDTQLWDIFDVFFKDALDTSSTYTTLTNSKLHYPIDVKETTSGIQFDVAIVGAEKKDVIIETENDILRIIYPNNENKDSTEKYLYKGITRKSFNFNWKLGGKFDVAQTVAAMDKGLLTIKIPYTKNATKKRVEIV